MGITLIDDGDGSHRSAGRWACGTSRAASRNTDLVISMLRKIDERHAAPDLEQCKSDNVPVWSGSRTVQHENVEGCVARVGAAYAKSAPGIQ